MSVSSGERLTRAVFPQAPHAIAREKGKNLFFSFRLFLCGLRVSAAVEVGRKGRRRPKRISTWVDQETRAESTTRKRERERERRRRKGKRSRKCFFSFPLSVLGKQHYTTSRQGKSMKSLIFFLPASRPSFFWVDGCDALPYIPPRLFPPT